jgi:glutamyl-tRNA synthetase
MGVTHIIRGDDHLNNAFRQLAIIRAMGFHEPVYAHVPLIHGPDGAKLSKRHGALGVQEYREMGILPDALFNYLLRLGWGHGDDEIISRDQAIEWFDLDHVGKSPSRFDMQKLLSLNGHYIQAEEPQKLTHYVLKAEAAHFELHGGNVEFRLGRAMPHLQPRAKTTKEIAEGSDFLFATRPLDVDAGGAELLTDEARGLLAAAHAALGALAEWDAGSVEAAIRDVAERSGVKLGKLAQPLRVALTGRTTSPGIFDVLALLGRDESLARVADQMLER